MKEWITNKLAKLSWGYIKYEIGYKLFDPTLGNMFPEGHCYDYINHKCDIGCQGASTCPYCENAYKGLDRKVTKEMMIEWGKRSLWNKLHFPTSDEIWNNMSDEDKEELRRIIDDMHSK